jgi:hypothetical protein
MNLILLIIILVILIFFMFRYIDYIFCKQENRVKIKNQINHTNKKIENYKNGIKILNQTPQLTVDQLFNLFNLYNTGIYDTYDVDGNLIKGIEPNAEKSIHYLNLLINRTKNKEKEKYMIELAKIYHFGMHKFEPNINRAEDIYLHILDICQNQDTYNEVQEKLKDIRRQKTLKWLNLPNRPPNTDRPPNTETPPNTNRLPEDMELDQDVRDYLIDNIGFNINLILDTQTRMLENFERNKTKIGKLKEYNDPQNTHDPQVLNTIKNSIKQLQKDSQNINNTNTIKQVNEYLHALPMSDKKNNAIRALNEVIGNQKELSSLGVKEIEALTLVWNRINSNKYSEETKNDLKEILCSQLASMIEYDMVVCSTGRATRLIDTLNGIDDEISIKPKYAINEEMMNKSGLIRRRMYDEVGDVEERKKLEMGTSCKQEEFDQKLKDTIINELKKDYVDSKILTQQSFNDNIKSWIDLI